MVFIFLPEAGWWKPKRSVQLWSGSFMCRGYSFHWLKSTCRMITCLLQCLCDVLTFAKLVVSGKSRTFKQTGQQFRDLAHYGSTRTRLGELYSFFLFLALHWLKGSHCLQSWLFANQNLWNSFAYGHTEGMGDACNTMPAAEHTPVRTHSLSLVHKSHSVGPLRPPTGVSLLMKLGAKGN